MEEFLEANGLDMLINTKDGLPNGIEESKCVLSVFSVLNYPKTNNKGGILRINKNLDVIPHIIKGSPSKGQWISGSQNKANFDLSDSESEIRKTMFQITA